MSKSRSSSLEQGELGATPDFNISPHIDLEMVTESELRREKERKRKREELEQLDEAEDILRIKPPQVRSSVYEDDTYKRFRRSDDRGDERSSSSSKKSHQSHHESDRLERLERERRRLDNERHRHLDRIQKERDHEREMARKEKSGRSDEDRRRDDRRDHRSRPAKTSHSGDFRKSRNESKESRAQNKAAPSPCPRKEEKRQEHRSNYQRSPELEERFSSGERRATKDIEDHHHHHDDQDMSDEASRDVESDKVVHDSEVKETPSVEKFNESPKYGDLYKLARSKFDVDEEEEQEEERNSGTQHSSDSNSGRRSPSPVEHREQSLTPQADEVDEDVEKDKSPENRDGDDDNTEEEKAVTMPEDAGDNDDDDEGDDQLLPLYYPAIQGCRSVEEFHCLNKINEGTYGVVYRAVDLKLREVVALKRLKLEKEKDGFPITSLREIKLLMMARHPNIVTIKEVVVGSNLDKVYMVMEYVEHDMKSLMESMKEPFTIGEVKTLMMQLLRGVQHLHNNWIIHRDLKTSNLLLSHSGILKIADFGLAREYGSPLKPYTPIVVTLWYRSPELLLGTKMYSTTVDMWSVGCIFAEFLLRKPLFVGKTEVDQLGRIFKVLGSPNEDIWPGVKDLPVMQKATFTQHPYNQLRKKFEPCLLSEKGFQLMNSMLTYCPEKRVTADIALTNDYFNETPLPTHTSMFPTWPAKSELYKSMKSPKAPTGGKAIPKLNSEKDLTKTANMPSQGFFFKFY